MPPRSSATGGGDKGSGQGASRRREVKQSHSDVEVVSLGSSQENCLHVPGATGQQAAAGTGQAPGRLSGSSTSGHGSGCSGAHPDTMPRLADPPPLLTGSKPSTDMVQQAGAAGPSTPAVLAATQLGKCVRPPSHAPLSPPPLHRQQPQHLRWKDELEEANTFRTGPTRSPLPPPPPRWLWQQQQQSPIFWRPDRRFAATGSVSGSQRRQWRGGAVFQSSAQLPRSSNSHSLH
jgi:hypothetical protein